VIGTFVSSEPCAVIFSVPSPSSPDCFTYCVNSTIRLSVQQSRAISACSALRWLSRSTLCRYFSASCAAAQSSAFIGSSGWKSMPGGFCAKTETMDSP
jgi:hypothetical protein